MSKPHNDRGPPCDAMAEFANSIPKKVHNKVGMRFGRLVVVAFDHIGYRNLAAWKVRCDCGTVKVVNGRNLGSPTKSCGCLQREWASQEKPSRRQPFRTKRLSGIYHNMLNRCLSPNNPAYHNYGGRGITVCDEWLADPISFYSWAQSNGYFPDLTLDRQDNSAGYSPSNCRWITRQGNANNRRGNVLVTHQNQTMTAADLARLTGSSYDRLVRRLKRGWTVTEALSVPAYHRKSAP